MVSGVFLKGVFLDFDSCKGFWAFLKVYLTLIVESVIVSLKSPPRL